MNIPDKNPWKGLDFYRESEVIYGRDTEIESLFEFVHHNTQVVLYGRSGIGKSSIINAGIFPLARKENMIPVSIKLIHDGSISYIDQIKVALCSKGIEAFELLPPISKEKETLWEFFHRHQFFNKDDQRVRLLLVLDQFEEIFTLQSKESVRREFFAELADLINNVAPDYIIQRQDHAGALDTASCVTGNDGEEFCLDLNNGIENKDYLTELPLRMIFVIREDFLSHMERYTSHIPIMRDNRFALLPLSEEQAAEIVMRPIPGLVSRAVAKLIISKVVGTAEFELDDLAELEVDSSVLSLYLSQLFNAMRKEGGTEITADLVEREGSNIISRFYEESTADMSVAKQEMLEDMLLTGDGRRDNVSRTDFINSGFSEKDVRYLVDDAKLLRQFSMQNDLRLELMHDVLCPAVLARKANREMEMREEAARLEEISWRRTRWVSILLIILCVVAGVYVYKNWDMVTHQRQRLAEMEKSVTAEVAKQMLDRRDIYGAMRLLVNAIDTTCYDSMDVINARYECLLRQALDSFNNSEYKCVAKSTMCLSYAKARKMHSGFEYDDFSACANDRYISFPIDDRTFRIFDTKTLFEVAKFPINSSAQLKVRDFSNDWMDWDSTEYATCLVIQDDSALLVCNFDKIHPNFDAPFEGTTFVSAAQNQKVQDARFLHHDSLIIEFTTRGFNVFTNPCQGTDVELVYSSGLFDTIGCTDFAISSDERLLCVQQGTNVYLYDTYSWTTKWVKDWGNRDDERGDCCPCFPRFSPDGKALILTKATFKHDNDWRYTTHHEILVSESGLERCLNGLHDYAFSPDSKKLYYCDSTNLICEDVQRGKRTILGKGSVFIPTLLNDSIILWLNRAQKAIIKHNIHTNTFSDRIYLDVDENNIFDFNILNDKCYVLTYNLMVYVFMLSNNALPICQTAVTDSLELQNTFFDYDTLDNRILLCWDGDLGCLFGQKCIDFEDKRILINRGRFKTSYVSLHYLHNGAIFYELNKKQPIQESRFTKDGRHIYIKPEDGEPYLMDLLPLPELVDSCKRILGPYWKYPSEEDRNRILSTF